MLLSILEMQHVVGVYFLMILSLTLIWQWRCLMLMWWIADLCRCRSKLLQIKGAAALWFPIGCHFVAQIPSSSSKIVQHPSHDSHIAFWESPTFDHCSSHYSICKLACRSNWIGCIPHCTYTRHWLWFGKCSLLDFLLWSGCRSHQQQSALAWIEGLQVASLWSCCGVWRPFWFAASLVRCTSS